MLIGNGSRISVTEVHGVLQWKQGKQEGKCTFSTVTLQLLTNLERTPGILKALNISKEQE